MHEEAERIRAQGIDTKSVNVPNTGHREAFYAVLPEIFDFFASHPRSADQGQSADQAHGVPRFTLTWVAVTTWLIETGGGQRILVDGFDPFGAVCQSGRCGGIFPPHFIGSSDGRGDSQRDHTGRQPDRLHTVRSLARRPFAGYPDDRSEDRSADHRPAFHLLSGPSSHSRHPLSEHHHKPPRSPTGGLRIHGMKTLPRLVGNALADRLRSCRPLLSQARDRPARALSSSNACPQGSPDPRCRSSAPARRCRRPALDRQSLLPKLSLTYRAERAARPRRPRGYISPH